jgi:hypothetical protein
MDYLVRAGVRRERLTAVGYGATKPIADNATAAGQAANRRVEFTVAVPSNGEVLYVLSFYWPFVAAVFTLGIVVGWWSEAKRVATRARAAAAPPRHARGSHRDRAFCRSLGDAARRLLPGLSTSVGCCSADGAERRGSRAVVAGARRGTCQTGSEAIAATRPRELPRRRSPPAASSLSVDQGELDPDVDMRLQELARGMEEELPLPSSMETDDFDEEDQLIVSDLDREFIVGDRRRGGLAGASAREDVADVGAPDDSRRRGRTSARASARVGS